MEMATKIDVPLVDEEVDASNPTSAIMAVVTLIAGFAIFSMTQGIGNYLANEANQSLSGVLGFNPATGESEDSGGFDLL
jgi:hypothetical protein